MAVIKGIQGYENYFQDAFNNMNDPSYDPSYDPVTFVNVGNAIGAFERTLVTPSKWDEYLEGDDSALTDQQKAGLAKFLDTGCASCHRGVAVGGQRFEKLGAMKDWPTQQPDDHGRSVITKNPDDDYFFKIPSLRNIDKTGPYLHNGSVATLDEMVKMMALYQLGKTLTDDEAKSIVTFLKSMTGERPKIEEPTPL